MKELKKSSKKNMNYRIEFKDKAKKDFNSLDNSIKKQAMKFLDKLAEVENPRAFGKPLEQNLAGLIA